MSCGLGRRFGSDLALLWLWRKPAAGAPIQPLSWELPYAAPVALKYKIGSFRSGAAETNLARNHEVLGSIPGLTQWIKDLVLPRAVV